MFNLSGEVTIGTTRLPQGVIVLPLRKHAENIHLANNAQLAGIRFFPAVEYSIWGQHHCTAYLLPKSNERHYKLYKLFDTLKKTNSLGDHISIIEQWAITNLNANKPFPSVLTNVLHMLEQPESLSNLCASVNLSQRQIERIFNRWLAITPKHYQRIVRIKKVIDYLRQNKTASLADVAQQYGFSDQAHMTREFNAIARKTPKQVGRI